MYIFKASVFYDFSNNFISNLFIKIFKKRTYVSLFTAIEEESKELHTYILLE